MKSVRLILPCIVLAVALSPFFPTVGRAASQEELFEKIKLLEMQIQELKEIKAQQNKTEEKVQHCMQAVGTEKVCTCLAEALPGDIGFEQYVHVIVASPVESRNDSRKRGEQVGVEAIHAAHDKCIQK